MAHSEQLDKYLKLARRAREEDNTEDAKKYYDMARTEDADNMEAKFFYSYYKLMDGTKGEAYGAYMNLCKGLSTIVRDISESDDSDEEKCKLLSDICVNFSTLPLFINRILNELNKGNNNHLSEIRSSGKAGMIALYCLGDDVAKYFGNKEQFMKVAAEFWKAGVYRQQQWYGMGVDKTYPEIYTAKIQKIDPSYIMPKKAGCISFAK